MKKRIKLYEGEYRVYMVNLPGTIHGACRMDKDDFPSIYINDQLCPDARRAAFLHEMRHIENGDFYSARSIREVEEG